MNKLPGQLECSDILFPETKETVIELWTTFSDLYHLITAPDVDETTGNQIFENGKQWINLFRSLGGKRQGYEKASVTPYMHCIPYHNPKVVRDHGSLKMFTGQGVEKIMTMPKSCTFKSQTSGMPHEMCLMGETRSSSH